MRLRVLFPAAIGLGVATAACSAILGLESPPGDDGGAPGGGPRDATTTEASVGDAGGDAGGDMGDDAADGGSLQDSGSAPSSCGVLDAGPYYPFDQVTIDDAGDTTWELFDSTQIPGLGSSPGFAGGTFDGRYVYFPAQNHFVVRYDSQGGGFANPAAWTVTYFNVTGGASFAGAVFDGRYVTLIPQIHSGSTTAVSARFDTTLPADFATPTSVAWEYFDLSTLAAEGGAPTYGFFGGVFDGRFIYFVPRNDGAPFGRVVRYDTAGSLDAGVLEAGVPGDAGDAGNAGDAGDAGDASAAPVGFANPSLWTTYDVGATNQTARGFVGGVLAAGAVYLVPNQNGAFDGSIDEGYTGVVTRYSIDAGFGTASSWTTFDMSQVSGYAQNEYGGAFDGRYVYFVPHGTGVVTRYDTTAPFGNLSSWQAYDTANTVRLEGGANSEFAGAVFDGRYLYLMPFDTRVSPVVRYDTANPFTAPCAWSVFDPSTLALPDGGHVGNFFGAVFDGQYVYLVPDGPTGSLFIRFAARTPGPVPAMPSFL